MAWGTLSGEVPDGLPEVTPITRPLKLLIFAHALQGRGTERALVRLLNEFDRSVIDPELALVAARGEFLEALPDDLVVHDLGMDGKRTSAAIARLSRLIRDRSPDCGLGIHISAGRVLSVLRLLHRRLPVLCMEADPFSRIEDDKGNLSLRTAVSHITYRLATHIIAASDVVADDLINRFGIAANKITIIPLPSVDAEVLDSSNETLSDPPFDQSDEPIIVTIGNMFAHKDQKTLIEAFDMIQDSIPCHLVLIGEGPLRPDLERFTRELGLERRVWFVGFQKNPFKYLSRSGVFVSPSAAEGFDISQIEAMACGLPVVVTDAPRFRAVEHGHSGLVVPPGDPSATARAVIEILESGEWAAELGRNARDAAMAYSSEKIARRYESLIQSVSGKRSSGRRQG